MPAPVVIAHTHVHSMRIASGEEALVARVLTDDGVSGFGFTLNFEAVVAREMAAWDAAARARNVPFHALFGKKTRERVEIFAGKVSVLDPFAGEPLDELRRRAQESPAVTLLAPRAHPWELAYCAALAATLPGQVRITTPQAPSPPFVAVPEVRGIGIDWSLEPAFSALRWVAP